MLEDIRDPIWLASYPRSGNTFLRTILWNCMGLRTASIYKNDLGSSKALQQVTGHVELSTGERFNDNELNLIKTHHLVKDSSAKAIYVVRDGRAAVVSMWHYYNKEAPLDVLIRATQTRFPTWTQHIAMWDPFKRPDTLLVRYEDLLVNLKPSLERIANFLDRPITSYELPKREDIAAKDGRWVRNPTNWQNDLKGKDLELFYQLNTPVMKALGYLA